MATVDTKFEADPKFHVENNSIITSKDSISVQQVFNFLSKNLEKFRVGSQFVVVSGVHGSDKGELLEYDEDLIYDMEMMFRWFKNHKKYSQQAKIVDERMYDMNTVIRVISDKSQEGKFVLSKQSMMNIKSEFDRILKLKQPIVLILFSCWSYRSQIADILRSNGIFTVMNVLEERGNITNGKMFLLDEEQQKFIKNVAHLVIKDVILMGNDFNLKIESKEQDFTENIWNELTKNLFLGHYGTGKTLLASEAVKMKLARRSQTLKNVDVYILTFNSSSMEYDGPMSYELLMNDLKTKWFADQDFIIQHFTDFLKRFKEEHEEHLNKKERIDLQQAQKGEYHPGGDHFKDVLITICEMMKKFNKTSIIMLDEVSLYHTCRKSTENGKTFFHVDFSYLAKYDNIHFVICMRPWGTKSKNFNLIFPINLESQLYQLLKNRHRSNIEILRFLKFYQKNLPQEYPHKWQNIDLEEVLDESSLPPVLDPPGYGVIWIPCGLGAQEEKKALDKVKDILAILIGEPSVSILYDFHDSKRLAENLFRANNRGTWNGPHYVDSFNGTESNVIINICDGFLDIEDLARARQLLIILTCGKFWNTTSNYAILELDKVMNEVVKQKLVMKIGDTKFTKMSPTFSSYPASNNRRNSN